MTAPLPVAGGDGPPLRPALSARLPGLELALATDRVAAALLTPAPGREVEGCTVGQVRLDADGTCGLRYRLRVRDQRSGRTEDVLVLGRVLPDVPRAEAYLRAVTRAAPAVAERREVRLLRAPVAALPGQGLVVHVFPIDPGLPTLPEATSPTSVLPVLRALPGTGTGGRGVAACTAGLAHYPRRDRCVLRYRLRAGSGGAGELRSPVVYGKVRGDDRGAGQRLVLHALHAAAPGLPVPRPLAYDPGLRLLVLSELPGVPRLPALLAELTGPGTGAVGAGAELDSALGGLGRLLARLHDARLDPGTVRPLAAELRRAEAEVAGLAPVWPWFAAHLGRVLGEVAVRAVAAPTLPLCTAHGDLTPAQVLLDGDSGRVGLVDLDGLTRAEPALDLGRFRAYLRMATARRGPGLPRDRLDDLTERLLDAYARARSMSSADTDLLRRRLPTYEALALVGAATSSCRQLKDRRLQTVLHLLHEEHP